MLAAISASIVPLKLLSILTKIYIEKALRTYSSYALIIDLCSLRANLPFAIFDSCSTICLLMSYWFTSQS